jgi:rod shape-determining protein MreC
MRSRDYSFSAASARPRRERLLVVVLLVTGVTLLALASSGSSAIGGARARMMAMLQPALAVVLKPVDAVHNATDGVHHFFATMDENRKLKAENDALRHWQSVAMGLKSENESLRQLANYQPVQEISYVSARVLSSSAGDFVQSLMIDAGKDDGILNLQPVVDTNGLVGRVVELGSHSARVLLLSDVASRVPVVTGDSRQRALLTGTGNELLRLNYVEPDAHIKLGELVTTTQEGGLIPGGIPVGTVFRHDESGYLVKPVRSLSRAEYVRVVQFTDGANVSE